MTNLSNLLSQRRAGVLLHITSLPGKQPCGNLGQEARAFVDFLQRCGIGVWQTLPVTPTHSDGSPYQCMSAHAGETRLIDLRGLVAAGWLKQLPRKNAGMSFDQWRERCLLRAYEAFEKQGKSAEYQRFLDDHAHWLPDFALYVALRDQYGKQPWIHWPQPLRDRDDAALAEARRSLMKQIDQAMFEQFVFFRQWGELRDYANSRGVALLGDMPIFVALDSAEVWVDRRYFDLDSQGSPNHVAGVPPDYFTEFGQRWGNPLYIWPQMESDGFRWWIDRMKTLLTLYDGVRIDHFRGFEAYWEIPSDQPTAVHGRWVEAPGHALLNRLFQSFPEGKLSLVAENLGLITPEVEALRSSFDLPGMLILQFGFEGGDSNPSFPSNHTENNVVYTGTHDNDTTVSWFTGLDEGHKHRILTHCGYPDLPMPYALMACAMNSRANLAVVPMQDILELGAGYRMNTPGTTGADNWNWRFQWHQLTDDQAEWLKNAVAGSGR